MSEQQSLSVAVVSSTIGRAELRRAIESVKAQSYPCKHYVFVDGEQFKAKAEAILKDYPDVVAVYLPMNTGKNKMYNSRINAIAPFLIDEDILCFLDDDNSYQPNHVETIVKAFCEHPSVVYAYSLRNFVDLDGNFLVRDTTESIGHYQRSMPEIFRGEFDLAGRGKLKTNHRLTPTKFVDVNCYAFKRQFAYKMAEAWNIKGFGNDKAVFKVLEHLKAKAVCTNQFSVNYTIDPNTVFNGQIHKLLSAYIKDEQKLNAAVYDFVIKINTSSQIIHSNQTQAVQTNHSDNA